MNYLITAPSAIDCHINLPASKSITNRAMIINALAHSVLDCSDDQLCDDCRRMRNALTTGQQHINVDASATAMRFLTAYFATQQGRKVVIDGNSRLRQRPIAPLVDALRSMGASINYNGHDGLPPVTVKGRRLKAQNVHVDARLSSQFVSALLLIAPVVGGFTLHIDGGIVSRPYIDMTLCMMRRHGINVECRGNCMVVPQGFYSNLEADIEGDWSAAAHWLALTALLPQSAISLSQLSPDSMQGDRAIVELMRPLGVVAQGQQHCVTLRCESGHPLPASFERDMTATPDLVPVVAVTLCMLNVPFRLTGLQSLRIKESDRIMALKQQLARLGYQLEETASTLACDGCCNPPQGTVVLDTCGDHRMAMALTLAATRHSISINDAQVVAKSYPQFWQHIHSAGFNIQEI